MISKSEARKTNEMIQDENLDVRTITMGINILDCADPSPEKFCTRPRRQQADLGHTGGDRRLRLRD